MFVLWIWNAWTTAKWLEGMRKSVHMRPSSLVSHTSNISSSTITITTSHQYHPVCSLNVLDFNWHSILNRTILFHAVFFFSFRRRPCTVYIPYAYDGEENTMKIESVKSITILYTFDSGYSMRERESKPNKNYFTHKKIPLFLATDWRNFSSDLA